MLVPQRYLPQIKVSDLKHAYRDGFRDSMGRTDQVLEKAFWGSFWKRLCTRIKTKKAKVSSKVSSKVSHR